MCLDQLSLKQFSTTLKREKISKNKLNNHYKKVAINSKANILNKIYNITYCYVTTGAIFWISEPTRTDAKNSKEQKMSKKYEQPWRTENREQFASWLDCCIVRLQSVINFLSLFYIHILSLIKVNVKAVQIQETPQKKCEVNM